MSVGYAPGKAILFGEYAVVFGHPAIAVPINQVRAEAVIQSRPLGSGILLCASDLGRCYRLTDAPSDDPLRAIVLRTLAALGLDERQDFEVVVTSTIPIARGLGSGTAVSVAVARALAAHFGASLPEATVSELVYEVEKIHHGRPSGIDNTVVTYGKPIYFVKGKPPEAIHVGCPFWLVVADTGVPSPTRAAVNDVCTRSELDPARYKRLFVEMGEVVRAARQAIETGDLPQVGELQNENQRLLREIDVSSPELERLIHAARQAGALGAKLSGAGRGGNMIALVQEADLCKVERALRDAGAYGVIVTEVR